MSQQFQHDVLVIGSGAAGLSLALTLPGHLRIAVLSKGDLANGSTFWAQGGVAAVLDDTDTVESHVDDTLNAGGGLCHEDAVRFTVEHSKEAIQWLIDQGVPFTRDEESGTEDGGFEFHLTREGGHSHRRIIHAADATGAAIFRTLLFQARQRPNIELLEQRVAVDLITERRLGLEGERCLAPTCSTATAAKWTPTVPASRFWPQAARRKSTFIPATLTGPVATASPWPGVPAVGSPTWSSTSSTPPACITRKPKASW